MTIVRLSPAEAVGEVDRLLQRGLITPIARTYLVMRIKQIMRDGNDGHRLYRLVEMYR